MSRKSSKVIDILVERRLHDQDSERRNQGMKDRLDYIGRMLNEFKLKWNLVNSTPAHHIKVADYEPKLFD